MNLTIVRAVWQPQFGVYVCVGVLTALVDVGTMALLLHAGSSIQMATTCGFALGLAVNCVLHAHVTFAVRLQWAKVLRFGVIAAMNYGLTLMLVWVAHKLGLDALTGKLASLPVVAIHGFLWGKSWACR